MGTVEVCLDSASHYRYNNGMQLKLDEIYAYAFKYYHILSLLGPLTHTSTTGKTTLYGVASQAGGPVRQNGLWVKCISTMLFVSVSDGDNLDWITKYINKYN